MRFIRFFMSGVVAFFHMHVALAQNSPSSFVAKQDVYQSVNPGQVEMNGFLGGRMDANKRYAVSRGPIVLALEKIKADKSRPYEVVPDLSSLDQAFLKGWAKSGTQHAILIKGKKIQSESEDPSGDVDLLYKPYCEAGLNGEVINIWLPAVKP